MTLMMITHYYLWLERWVSSFPFCTGNRNVNEKSNDKISFHYFDLNGKEKTFCEQAITLMKYFYDRWYNYLVDI